MKAGNKRRINNKAHSDFSKFGNAPAATAFIQQRPFSPLSI